jgi:hypothetical protein
MTSAIDPTKPTHVNPLTADVRSNFSAAASEITALQNGQNTGVSGSGLLSLSSGNSGAARTLTASTGITITNGTGVAGNPTVAVDATVYTMANLTFSGGLTYGGNVLTVPILDLFLLNNVI